MTADAADASARLRAFIEAWNSHELDRIAGLFSPEAIIEDELVVIDPDRPAGRRTYRGSAEIRAFAALAAPGFQATVVDHSAEGQAVRFVALVRADGLRRRGIEAIEQHDSLTYEGDLVRHFRIEYPPQSRAQLRAASGPSSEDRA
jgi:hypothetical protein